MTGGKENKMKQSVTELFEMYISCSDLTASSVDLKRRAFGFFSCLFSDVALEELTFCHGEDFRNYLAKGRSRQSANIYLANTKPFFSWLVRRGFLKINPFGEVAAFRIGNKISETFTPDEIGRMLTVADTRWKVIILLALSSMRRSEILNLTVRDIDFDKGYITIREKKDTDRTWSWTIKNHNQAMVPLVGPAEKMLIELIDELDTQPYVIITPSYYRHLMKRKAAGRLHFRLRNCPWGNFTRDFLKLLSRASVRRKRFHSLRATFATNMDSANLSLPEIQKLMRHSNPAITARYIRHDENELVARSARAVEQFLR